ncbi:1959_t:CDS:1 [Funneliformis geosporum]|uniref:542_t:CDS:1 n=1 Tax=Funneliformis geosporum TaxID=1117311 RepID=A0A9W4T191_9GLOM|nr:542_t:CDS:1 [Funneliformis geosporum]CAI2189036.1 1959_t:CDS:1 [Funneliformis geosporum]
MPKISNPKLQNLRLNRQNDKNTKNSPDDRTALEIISGLRAENIPPPDIDFIKRVLKNSRKAKTKKNDPPRPPNAFFLFRNALHSHLSAHNLKVPQVSAAAGKLWNNAGDEMKSKYIRLQEFAKSLHLQMHPGYVYRPRRNIQTTSSSNLELDKISFENKPTSNTSVAPPLPDTFSSYSISEPSSPIKFVDSDLEQLTIIQHNQDIYETKDKSTRYSSRDFITSGHNGPNQKLMEFHQESTQPKQSLPTFLDHYSSPVQNQSKRYYDINSKFLQDQRHQSFTSQQLNQIDPVSIAFPVTSVDNFIMTLGHQALSNLNSTPNLNYAVPNNSGFDVRPIDEPYHYNLPARFDFVDNQGNEFFEDWIDWDYFTKDTF